MLIKLSLNIPRESGNMPRVYSLKYKVQVVSFADVAWSELINGHYTWKCQIVLMDEGRVS